MPRETEGGRLKTVNGVALFTAVAERRVCELPAVRVAVAVHAGLERGVVIGVETARLMTFCARYCGVLAGKTKPRVFAICHGVLRRAEAGIRVTRTAFAAGTVRELAFVRILVAIHALRVRNGRLEICVFVALQASHRRVLPGQREVGLVMVKCVRRADLAPALLVMAGLASRRESPVVRIAVTTAALCKIQTGVLNDFRIPRRLTMASGALYIPMAAV